MAARNKLIRSAEHIGPFMRTKPCAPSNAQPPPPVHSVKNGRSEFGVSLGRAARGGVA